MVARRGQAGRRSKIALVCAGGGITGAVYEIGCLRALQELLDRSLLDLDLYVGVSGGAFVSSLLAFGIEPAEIYDQVAAQRPFGASALPVFRLGLQDLARGAWRAPRVLRDALRSALSGDGRGATDLALSLFEVLPAGLLDNSGIQEFLAGLLRRRRQRDRFDALSRELLVVAVDLDSGEAVAFGDERHRGVAVSKAVQASTALPGLYRPVRIGRRDYVDGGVKKTAHINLAIQRGAELVICINPIVPILNVGRQAPLRGRLAGRGASFVLDQALRIMLHGRMQYGLDRYAAEHPEVDILVIEPTRHDMRMFGYNIMRMSARQVVAEDGYRSVRHSFRRKHGELSRMLRRHGIQLREPGSAPRWPPSGAARAPVASRLRGSLARLERKLG